MSIINPSQKITEIITPLTHKSVRLWGVQIWSINGDKTEIKSPMDPFKGTRTQLDSFCERLMGMMMDMGLEAHQVKVWDLGKA